ncbi:MAG TPA: spore coat protein U domain-containing protein [Alphaproteobacteria bacterium]|nr:spore coat protein U domain-containing protein [Alphaproteobacteria bacterium]
MTKVAVHALSFAVVAVAGTSTAMAQTGRATSVTVNATKLNFGTKLNPFSLPADTTATLTLKYKNNVGTCVGSSVVTLSPGLGVGATAGNRKMTSGGNTLSYTIYTPPGPPTTVWDNVIGYTTPSISITKGSTTTQTVTMYGRILGNQSNAAVGSYTDTVTITVLF